MKNHPLACSFILLTRLLVVSVLTASLLIIFSSDGRALTKPSSKELNDFYQWAVSFSHKAEQKGIRPSTLYHFLKNIQYDPKVITLDQKQPYKTKTFSQYLDHVVPKSRVKRANQRYKKYQSTLNKIGKKYGVQPRFIVALWGIESDFGRNMGRFNILNSLATLAFEGRRRKFFSIELMHALTIIDEEHITYDKMLGSWAGAMGQTQFMPSSFIELAVDGNNDGRKDIWHTKHDAFSSIANYLSKRGWDHKTTWGRQVKLPKSFNKKLIGKDTIKTLEEWQSIGVRKADGSALPNRRDLTASLIQPGDSEDKFFLVYSNYMTILKWNRSLYFATAVGILADQIVTNE